jgi:hypothetical protein
MDNIGIIALLLAIPLSVLANLLTPTVKNWLALRSRKRLLYRLAVIEDRLARFGKLGLQDIYDTLKYIFLTLVFICYGLTLASISLFYPQLTKIYGLSSYIVFFLAELFAFQGLLNLTRNFAPAYKVRLEKSLILLKRKRDAVDNSENPSK